MLTMQPKFGQGVIGNGFQDRQRIIMMPVKIVDAPAINGKGIVKVRPDHGGVLDVPGGSSPPYFRIPGYTFPLFVSVPKDKITTIPLHSRVSIFMETSFLSGPFRHVQAKKLAEARKLQRIKVNVSVMPIGNACFNQPLDNLDSFTNSF
jgi:hypothetical protein